MSARHIPEAVITAQHAASDPAVSAWVSANAGAGKTHVLAQRVIRLLLEGTDPAKILCLTFTKAAAANMANRIFDTLSAWTALDDAKLDDAIHKTGAKHIDAKRRARARRLFASTLETPGGLKVQTIHGFCTRLLQQFPFEANVAARFRVLEDTEQTQMLEQIRRDVLLESANQPESPLGGALTAIIPVATDQAFQDALDEAIQERDRLAAWLDHARGGASAELSRALAIDPADTLERVEADFFEATLIAPTEWPAVIAALMEGSKNDQDQSARFSRLHALAGEERLKTYLSVFCTAELEPRNNIVTKTIQTRHASLFQRLVAEQDRVCRLIARRRAVIVRDRTMALLAIAVEVIERYAAAKNRRGVLDYDDLIARTRDLLDRVDAAWVHYKLDLGIDHLLIDEAQDTSPDQWDIIKRFVAEFTAGAGARGALKRSIFAVGDDKQSIFSFQGAAPKAFADMRMFFKSAHANAQQPFLAIPFQYSFRSVPTVLDAVDVVFKQPAAHAGLTADPVATVHQAVRAAAPGLVELWPLVEPDARPEVDPWDAPFDTTSETSPRVKLARRIAAAVKTSIDRRDPVGDGDQRHPVRAGDILILVRQRGPLFEAIIRALKNASIAVAGADRLVLTDHIAIMDLLVLADALLHAPDDLALATVLKSPLFGLSEDELFALAHDRKGTLRAALRPELAAKLDAIGTAARSLTPFAFYAELLGRHGGRKAFLARLGPEANDALDEFLNLALDYESRETPSLQGFVAWLRTASAEVKHDMEIARDEVRVMTVHGAKGLEAAVVVLADTTTQPAGPVHFQPRLLPLPAQNAAPGTPDRIAWMPSKKDDTAPIAAARLRAIEADTNEYRRLLYVAMTRAADRLIVCGAVGANAMPAGCWYDLVKQGLDATGALTDEPADFGEGTVWRYRKASPESGEAAIAAQPAVHVSAPALPSWLTGNVPIDPLRAGLLRPSSAFDDDDAGSMPGHGIERRKALARGALVHRLMQALPDIALENRLAAAQRHLARQKDDFSDSEREAIARQVLAVLDDPRFAPLFAPGSRAEVPIVGRVAGRPVSGQVDRLAVTPEAVMIADYKTHRPAPRRLEDVPVSTVTQLALYRAVLASLYPGRTIRAAVVWTEVPDLMEIPASMLDASLTRLTSA